MGDLEESVAFSGGGQGLEGALPKPPRLHGPLVGLHDGLQRRPQPLRSLAPRVGAPVRYPPIKPDRTATAEMITAAIMMTLARSAIENAIKGNMSDSRNDVANSGSGERNSAVPNCMGFAHIS